MRVKSLFTLLIAIPFALNASQSALAENPAAEAYRDQRDRLHAIERRPNALETVAQAQDTEVLREALEDLLKFSYTSAENQVALENIETALAKIPETDLEHQKVTLFKGKVLRRLGRMEEGDAIFARAFEEQWGQAHYENERSLLELRDFAGATVLEFERVCGLLNGNQYQVAPYEDGIEDLGRFKMYLGRLKVEEPGVSAMDAVFAKIESLDAPSLMKEIAKALCLSEDGRHEDALEVIERIESTANSADPAAKFIPLHKSMVLMNQDEIEAAQEVFREFMAALGDNYKVIHSAGIRFARSLELTEENKAKMDEVTGLLIDSPIIQDESVKATFSDYEIAHLYDLHQMGLAWSGQFDESAAICFHVIENYFPDNLAAANCVMNYARYISWYDGGDLEAALDLLNSVASRAPSDAIMHWVRLAQAEILLQKGERFQAITYIQDAMTRSLMNDGGVERLALDLALELQQQALSN